MKKTNIASHFYNLADVCNDIIFYKGNALKIWQFAAVNLCEGFFTVAKLFRA